MRIGFGIVLLLYFAHAGYGQGGLGPPGRHRFVGTGFPADTAFDCPLCGTVRLEGDADGTTLTPLTVDFYTWRAAATLSSPTGRMLLHTNGFSISRPGFGLVPNGTGLIPTPFGYSYFYDGNTYLQSSLLLPLPADTTQVLMLNTGANTYDEAMSRIISTHIWINRLKEGVNGQFEMLSKNEVLLSDSLGGGGLLWACKHANGRDWWVQSRKFNKTLMHQYLVSPDSIYHYTQTIVGLDTLESYTGRFFSHDGTWLASYSNLSYASQYQGIGSVRFFSFDRCTGLLQHLATIPDPDQGEYIGAFGCFSPTDKYFYFCNYRYVWRIPMQGSLQANSVEVVATNPFYFDSVPPAIGHSFFGMEPSNDGKIYIGGGSGYQYYSVIENPEAQNVQDVGFGYFTYEIPYFNVATYTNHPYYTLGPVLGSVCDSLGMGLNYSKVEQLGLGVQPNPSDGSALLNFNQVNEAAWLEVLNLQGQVLHQEGINPGSSEHTLTAPAMANGVYVLRLRTQSGKEGRIKWVIHHRQ